VTVHDLSAELLKQIRDGVHEANRRIERTRVELSARNDETNARIDQTNERLDRTREELIERIDGLRAELTERIDQTNTRLGRLEGHVGELVGITSTISERDRGLAQDVADLQRRVEALENRPAP
jgi:chromosome segregation ATPase